MDQGRGLPDVITIDNGPEFAGKALASCEECGLLPRTTIIKASAEQMPFLDNYFSLIVSRGSIFFWKDQTQGLRETYRVLRPGGAAYIGGGSNRLMPQAEIEEFFKWAKPRHREAYADGAVSESSYKSKLNQFKKLETMLFKSHNALHPSQLGELSALEERIGRVKDILSRGSIYITEFGLFGAKSDEYFPAGFNAWRESDGKLAIGEFRESDRIPIEGTDQEMRGIGAPPVFWEC